MDEGRYRGGMTAGGAWGTAAALLIGLPLWWILLIAYTIGDCAEGVDCHRGSWFYILVPPLVLGLAVGLTVRALVNGLGRSRRRAAEKSALTDEERRTVVERVKRSMRRAFLSRMSWP